MSQFRGKGAAAISRLQQRSDEDEDEEDSMHSDENEVDVDEEPDAAAIARMPIFGAGGKGAAMFHGKGAAMYRGKGGAVMARMEQSPENVADNEEDNEKEAQNAAVFSGSASAAETSNDSGKPLTPGIEAEGPDSTGISGVLMTPTTPPGPTSSNSPIGLQEELNSETQEDERRMEQNEAISSSINEADLQTTKTNGESTQNQDPPPKLETSVKADKQDMTDKRGKRERNEEEEHVEAGRQQDRESAPKRAKKDADEKREVVMDFDNFMKAIKATSEKMPKVMAWAEKAKKTKQQTLRKISGYLEKAGAFVETRSTEGEVEPILMWNWIAGKAKFAGGGKRMKEAYELLLQEKA